MGGRGGYPGLDGCGIPEMQTQDSWFCVIIIETCLHAGSSVPTNFETDCMFFSKSGCIWSKLGVFPLFRHRTASIHSVVVRAFVIADSQLELLLDQSLIISLSAFLSDLAKLLSCQFPSAIVHKDRGN